MTTTTIRTRTREKLISELPLKEGLTVYLETWRQLVSTAIKTITAAGVGLLIVTFASMFLTTATVLGITSSIVTFFIGFISDHPIGMLLMLIVFVVGFFAVRGARGAHQ